MKIAFIGDISFNDKYMQLYDSGADPFGEVGTILSRFDHVIGNLECLSEGDEGENVLKQPRLKTGRETLNYLKNLHISAVTLAHNHVFDNLKDGFVKTVSFLQSNHIEYLGAGLSEDEAKKPLIINDGEIKLCFLSYVHQDTNPSLPDGCPVHLNLYQKEKIVAEVGSWRSRGFEVILLLHWGGRFEGGRYPDRYQVSDAKAFTKAGAGLIIGHHTHTLQPVQKIAGKTVLYSLGNFCFADIHYNGKIREMSRSRFRESVIAVATYDVHGNSPMELLPIKNESLTIGEDQSVLRRLSWRNAVQKLFHWLPPLWFLYACNHRIVAPIWYQLIRKNAEKSLLRRILGLNLSKIKALLKI